MIDGRTYDFPELPIDQDGVKDGTVQNTICNRRIEHITTTAVKIIDSRRKHPDIRPDKRDSVINSPNVHHKIFDAIKQMDNPALIITQDNIHIINSNKIPTNK